MPEISGQPSSLPYDKLRNKSYSMLELSGNSVSYHTYPANPYIAAKNSSISILPASQASSL